MKQTTSTLCDCGCLQHYSRVTRIGQALVGTISCNLCGNFVVHATMSAHRASLSCVPPA
jgi:hypothetical protein